MKDVVACYSDFVIEYKGTEIFTKKYKLDDVLGKGAFGRVYKGTLLANGE